MAAREKHGGGPSRLMPLAVAGSAALALAGGVLFWIATQTATGPERGDVHKVVVGERSCEPADFTLPAGRATFEIHNASSRPIEWEILDGVMVVEERENIAPGFHSLLTAKLRPGSYAITCGLLSNPRGVLTVTPSAQSEAERARPPITAFIGPLSEYKVYLAAQSGLLVKEAAKLEAAVRAGDVEAAKAAWLAARLPYKRIEPVGGRIADLENAIDPLPDYLAGREQDPAFTGFHRLEYGLWRQGTAEGLAPVAQRLSADVAALKERLKALKLQPDELAGTALRQAQRLGDGQLRDGESTHALSDLAEMEANLDGMEKSVVLLKPLLAEAAPDAAAAIDKAFAETRAALQSHRDGDAYLAYDRLDAGARAALAAKFNALAGAIAALNPAIGLE